MASKAELELRETLLMTGLVQPVKSSGRGSKVSILCRQIPGQEKQWLKAVQCILNRAEQKGFEVHICRQYVLRDGQIVFGWHISIEAKKAAALVEQMSEVRQALVGIEPDLTPAVVKKEIETRKDDEEDIAIVQKALVGKPVDPKELAIRRAEYQKHTTAPPRELSPEGPDPVPPPGASIKLELVTNKRDRKTGQPIIEYEMPLPHMYRDDMNVPNKKGRGAWAGDFHVDFGRK